MTNNKQNKNKNGKRNNKVAKLPKRMPRPGLTALERMILDPCNAPLKPIYSSRMGGGQVFRVRARFALRSTAADSSGYLVWFPSFHNGGVDETDDIIGATNTLKGGANLFSFGATAFSGRPANSTATPFGTSVNVSGSAGRALADPAFDLVDSQNVSEARTLAACMKIKYVGSTSTRQGEIFVVKNLAQNALVRSTGSVSSIGEIAQYASTTCRMPASEMEIVWRPNGEAEVPRKVGVSAASAMPASLESYATDAPFVLGVPAGADLTEQSNSSLAGAPSGIAVAYASLNSAESNDVIIELTKIVQLRYSPLRGTVETTDVPTGREETSDQATAALDAKLGGSDWSVRNAMDAGQRAADNVADVVLGGVSIINTLDRARRGLRRGRYNELM
jgi:hypothetical protein